MKPKMFPFLFLTLLLVSLISACAQQETVLTGDEQEAVLAFSEAKTDNLLAGMNANDYATFSADFDEAMLKAMTEAQFANLKTDRDAKLGLYVSREVSSVAQMGEFYIVRYAAIFEKEATVNMRVVFRVAEPNQVSGLWFEK